ncbi:MAG: hypothetical protein IJI46_07850 [Erysipelotrichaceae bacterium]|nr:hypothetical protein [Erysipelotrichaceae bacterium]
MREFRVGKFLLAILAGAFLTFFLYGIFRLSDALMIAACLTIIYSFTFIHTMMGNIASRSGSILNQYEKVSYDRRYNIREERGFIPETLIVGVIELIVSLFLSYR